MLLRPYLSQRSDWAQIDKGFNDTADDGAANESRSFRDRLGMGRLSVMMKELEGLKLGESIPVPALPASFGFGGT